MSHLQIFSSPNLSPHFQFEIDQDLRGMVVILGANGAGKTTFLRTIHGMRQREVAWDGKAANESKLMRGFVPQSPVFFSGSLRRNLMTAAQFAGLSKVDIEPRIAELAEEYSLHDLLAQNASTLSGGETARAALARACLHNPKTLLLDEVTAHLDPESTKVIEKDLQHFAKLPDQTVLFVTHSLSQARRLADRVIFIDHGQLRYVGGAETFWHNSQDDQIEKFLAGELL